MKMAWAAAAWAIVAACPAIGQLFVALDRAPLDAGPGYCVPGPRPEGGVVVDLDRAALAALLAAAPVERRGEPLAWYGLKVELPHPEGGLVRCRVADSPVMVPELAARYPEIRSCVVESSRRDAWGRLELTPRGLTAMLRTASGRTWMIDLWRSSEPSRAVVYWLDTLPGAAVECHTVPGDAAGDRADDHAPPAFGPRSVVMRTARLAVACTGEFGLYHSTIRGHAPNVADALAAVVTIVSRANVVFEGDLALRFVLVANNDRAIFVDPATDPFPTTCDGSSGSDCSGPILNSLSNALLNAVGPGYDTGHALTRVVGGVAMLRAACNRGLGVSGTPRGGDLDPYAANVLIHELGHQLGANHTLSGVHGRCNGGNRSTATAWEAGGGSSPMAYAGACPVGDGTPSDNVVRFADPFFHHGSIEEMRGSIERTATCLTTSSSPNHPPVITSTTPNQPIPPLTPFSLSVAASDEDGDPLTCSWEQFDSGVARPLTGPGSDDNGFGALFRIFPPVAEPTRTFPRMSDVLSGRPNPSTPGERLPQVAGVRRFRAVVRDNRAGAGASVLSPMVSLTVAGSPFAVLRPAEGDRAFGVARVEWSVGGTDAPPFGHSQVALSLSLDDGATFPIDLGTHANTGSAAVTLPDVDVALARVRVDPVGAVFFAVSRPFVIAPCPADFDRDGFVDFFDYDAYVGCFEGVLCPPGRDADFNGDGFTDFQDLDAFVLRFEFDC